TAGELMLRAAISYFQATERFDRFVAFESGCQAGRFVMILILAGTGTLSVETVLISYATMGFVAAALGAARLPRGLFTLRPVPKNVLRESANFFIWTVFAFGLAAVTDRSDLFLLGRFRG